ncbi:MAG: NUDIX domain-containing protein, partial [Bacteroidales bacterium]|nr:NUDIX domain-containing protein [Bacteroidales bacterium]
MYQIYINNRVISLSDDLKKYSLQKYRLFYKYNDASGLSESVISFINSDKTPSLFVYHTNMLELWAEFRKIFRVIEAAGGLVWNKAGRFLAIKRFGIWDLPKGKKNKGESTELCALREVSEECGISEPELKNLLGITYHMYFLKSKLVLKETSWFEMFHSGLDQLIPQIEEDITEARWFNPDEVSVITKNTYPSIIDILEKAGIITG